MPRALRIQHPGALYHVLNRGNYRSSIFADEGASRAFLSVLHEAVARYGWRLHAYVLMSNHYHLALETPQPNLVEGMHWLQGTFCNRFNRHRRQNGHVFQGRYKAILLEDKTALARVVDYIHLNPVRAGIASSVCVEEYPSSSLREFLKAKGRPAGLVCEGWLHERGGWHDNASGLRKYLQYLHEIGGDEQEQKKAGLEKLSRGWALGTHGWKQALARELGHKVYAEGLTAEEVKGVKLLQWENLVREALQAAGREEGELETHPRLQSWKIEIAAKMRQSGVPVAWLAEKLHLGKPTSVRNYLHRHHAKKK